MTLKSRSIYKGCRVGFLTQHGKQDLIRNPLEDALGCVLVHTDRYDTDQLGTFTREVPRLGSQLDAARTKARLALQLTDARVGISSEGAFGPDPFSGFVQWNTELLLWMDLDRSIEVVGRAHGPCRSLQRPITTMDELMQFAMQAGFPSHQLVLRPDHEGHPNVRKGLGDVPRLKEAFRAVIAESEGGVAFVENDLRAICNPTRQHVIRQALQDLIARLRSACPACSAPGYWVTRKIPGLHCETCTSPTRLPVGEVWRCLACDVQESRLYKEVGGADPRHCDVCNP